VITMRQRPLENTRTPDRSCVYEAECEVDGRCYSTRSRHGAPNELARVLVSAGIPDQSVEVRHTDIKGCLCWRSLNEMARWTYAESATGSLRRVRWKPIPDFTAAGWVRIAQNRGEPPPPGRVLPAVALRSPEPEKIEASPAVPRLVRRAP
jgi:hypothetical protein